MPIVVPTYVDEFLNNYVMDHDWFADKETTERALNDLTGTCDYLPFMYDRCIPDPANPEQLLLIFSYGTANFQFEKDAPARVEECLSALTNAHPEFATLPRSISLMGA